MAKIKQGILGGINGRIGGVTGGAWKGIAYIRSIPVSVANPNTAGQIAQRGRMRVISQMASALLSGIIKPLNDRFAVQMSGYNVFVQRNTSAVSEAGIVALADLVMSKGKMASVAVNFADYLHGTNVSTISWGTGLPDAYAQGTDKAYIAVVGESGEVLGVSSGEVSRADGEAIVTMDRNFILGEKVAVYLSFLRTDGTVVSDSSFDVVTVN